MRQECLGPEQQFPQAFSARKDSPFLGSDSLVEEEQQSKLEMLLHRVQAPESRLSTFAKNPRSAAKTAGGGTRGLVLPANHSCTAGQSDRPLSSMEMFSLSPLTTGRDSVELVQSLRSPGGRGAESLPAEKGIFSGFQD